MIFKCVMSGTNQTLKAGTIYIDDQSSNDNVLVVTPYPYGTYAMNGDGTAAENPARFANDGLLIRRARLEFLGAPGLRPGIYQNGQMSSAEVYLNGDGEAAPENPRDIYRIEFPRFGEWVDINAHLSSRAVPWNVQGAAITAYYDMLGIQDAFIGRVVTPVLYLDLQGTWIG